MFLILKEEFSIFISKNQFANKVLINNSNQSQPSNLKLTVEIILIQKTQFSLLPI
jgi:hypothetical protein